MRYHHVDVFTDRPFHGNSLAVFPDADSLTGTQMLAITRELRHFESVFLMGDGTSGPRTRRARVFDLTGELDFAGHPLIGAAAVLHALHGAADHEAWTLRLPARPVEVTTDRRGRIGAGEPGLLRQGRFTGRTGEMTVSADGDGRNIRSVRVGGGVALVAEGRLHELPPA
ncbi:PhzF family phenazine biosynthesis protein [Streptomyces sp. NPDC097617]|uniref:PhzF family phenazine biosynthesis protein n=1 Tax=Streptomyces sp. NPDC097617 TaxID=3366091 RepID=UPI00382ECAF1